MSAATAESASEQTTPTTQASPPDQPDQPDQPTPPTRPRRRRVRQVLLAVAVLLLALVVWGVVQLVLAPSARYGPGDTDPRGHSALASLLRDEDLTVTETDTFGEVRSRTTEDTTVVINSAYYLDGDGWRALLDLRPGRIVLINPTPEDLERLGLPVRATQLADAATQIAPQCDDPAAQRAGTITVAYPVLFTSSSARTSCYPIDTDGHLHLVLDVDGVEVVLTQEIGTNADITDDGNAALSMQALGAHQSVVWWFPRRYDRTLPGLPTESGNSNGLPYPTLLPPGWGHAVGLSVIALVVVAIWRGRRLGPVLTEDLPSVVPASETVEGHGRLYGRLAARDTAAEHLRAAAIDRLARLTGHAGDTELLAQALADRTGWSYGEIRHLLDGPAPSSDEHLVILKRKLDALEQEARRP